MGKSVRRKIYKFSESATWDQWTTQILFLKDRLRLPQLAAEIRFVAEGLALEFGVEISFSVQKAGLHLGLSESSMRRAAKRLCELGFLAFRPSKCGCAGFYTPLMPGVGTTLLSGAATSAKETRSNEFFENSTRNSDGKKVQNATTAKASRKS